MTIVINIGMLILLIDIKIIMIVEACGSQDMGALGLASSVLQRLTYWWLVENEGI